MTHLILTNSNMVRALAAVFGLTVVLQLGQNFAADVAPGTKLWEFQTGSSIQTGLAIGKNELVYAALNTGRFVALKGGTGDLAWESNALGSNAPSIAEDGTVYLFDRLADKLISLDGITGIQRRDSFPARLFPNGFAWRSIALGSDGALFLGGVGRVAALDPFLGTVRWAITNLSTAFTPLVIGSDGTVFFGGLDGKLRAHDGRSGEMLWEYTAGDAMNFPPILDENENVYIGSNNGSLYSVRGADGVLNWQGRLSGMPYSQVLGTSETIYVGAATKVYCLDRRTGKKVWEFDAAGSIGWASPAVAADGTVYVGCGYQTGKSLDGKFYALDGRTGAKIWEFAGGYVDTSPAIGTDGTVYFASRTAEFDGKIYAVKGTPLASSAWPMFGRNQQHTSRAADKPPVITQQPRDQVVALGTTAQLAVITSGSPGVYHWWHEGALVSTGVSATLTLTNVQANDAGVYSVIVTNPVGKAVSATARLVLHNSLTVPVSGQGRVRLDPDLPTYPPGTSVTLTPETSPGNFFLEWQGDVQGDQAPLKVILDRNLTIGARFVDTTLRFAVLGVGAITASGGTQPLPPKTEVVLTATPGRWHRFAHWIDGTTNNPRLIRIGAENNYTAVFEPTESLETVTIGGVSRLAPAGMPAILLDGVFALTNPPLKTNSVQVQLRTTFPRGAIFYTLDGSAPNFLSKEYSSAFSLKEPGSIRAIAYTSDFTMSSETDPLVVTVLPTYSLDISTRGGGSVRVDPPLGPYLTGSKVTLTAIPTSGWVFLGWTGSVSATNSLLQSVMDSSKRVEAVFGTSIAVNLIGSGRVQIVPPNAIPYGSKVRITALPDAGNFFFRWAGATAGNFSPVEIAITESGLSISALFAPTSNTQTALTVLVDGAGRVDANPAKNLFSKGDTVTLNAMPENGRGFLGWELDGSGKSNSITVTMDRDKTVRAVFSPATIDPPRLEILSARPIRFRFQTQRGVNYSVEASNDAREWSAIGDFSGTENAIEFIDERGALFRQQFYRVRVK